MTIEAKEMTDNEARRLITVVCSPYTESEVYHRAMSRLVEANRLTDDVYARARQQRMYRYSAQCNVVVTHSARQLVDEWQATRDCRGTELELETWLIGKSVGKISQDWLIVLMDGNPIRVMECTQAEKMTFRMIHGHFRLASNVTMSEMVIEAFAH